MGGLERSPPGASGHGRRRAPAKGGGRRDAGALIDAVFPDAPGERDTAGTADLQSLLSGGVRDVVRRTGARQVAAWIARPGDGAPVLAALHKKRGDPPSMSGEQFATLRRLGIVTDLGEPRLDSCLAALCQQTGLSAAAPLYHTELEPGASDSEPAMGALLLGGPDDPAGRVRPRTLAMLSEVAANLRGPLSTVHAMTRISELDEKISRLDRLASLGDLMTEIVHEVRNPLVSVKTFLQLLPDRLDDPEFHEDFRLVVSEEVARLERLIDSVLRHGAPQTTQDAEAGTSVGETCETVANLLAHRVQDRGLTLVLPEDAAGLHVAMAADALHQVVLNLTLNALDATAQGGQVRLCARAQSVADGRWVELGIEDEGKGIPGDVRGRIFEPFFSTRQEKTGGLGLAISKRLVEEAGGRIRVESAEAGGARFVIRLEAARAR